MKNLKASFALFAILILISLGVSAQQNYSVKVVVKGLAEREGKIFAVITNDSKNFPGTSGLKSTSVEVSKEGEVTLSFTEIPEGRYAIFLFQDLNGNARIDMSGQMPAEPFGFSNVTDLMGPPSFEECAFYVNENKILEIGLFSF